RDPHIERTDRIVVRHDPIGAALILALEVGTDAVHRIFATDTGDRSCTECRVVSGTIFWAENLHRAAVVTISATVGGRAVTRHGWVGVAHQRPCPIEIDAVHRTGATTVVRTYRRFRRAMI